MSGFLENAYSLVHQDNAADVPSVSDLRMQLEKGTDDHPEAPLPRLLPVLLP
ncbi:coatomer beta subunit, partial [Lasius niger]